MNDEEHRKYTKSLNILATIIVSFAASILIIPPFFTEKGIMIAIPKIFSFHIKGLFGGIYYDNVYYTLLFLYFSIIMLSGPFFVPTLNKWIIRLSIGVGAWYTAGLAYEISNFTTPEEVRNTNKDVAIYNEYLMAFIIFISFLITIETWIKLKKFRK